MNRFQQQEPNQQVQQWQNELIDYGSIENEAELLNLFQKMDLQQEEDRLIASQLLTMVALSLSTKGRSNTLVHAWMDKAMQLNPRNEQANEYMLRYKWDQNSTLVDILTFPPLRETDNKQAKKQTLETYMEICEEFLNKAEETMEKAAFYKSPSTDFLHGDSSKMFQLLEQVMEVCTSLLKTTKAYEQTMVGAFHTAVHFDDMKRHIAEIEEIKMEWKQLFTADPSRLEEMEITPLEELRGMIGLESVKRKVHDFYQFIKYQKVRKEIGFQNKDEVSLNMIITGNPGTGKTTIARLYAKIYHELGVLPGREVIEVDRAQLVGSYVGQTEENVRLAVERALGGVLFIDEAYNLKREGQSGNDYGQTAIDALVSFMTGKEYGGKFSVILAGFPDEMRQFLDGAPGLRSRFPISNHLFLPDYSNEELIMIGEKIASENDYILTEDAKLALEERIERERVDHSFGNARTVRHLILDAIFQKGALAHPEDHQDLLHFSVLDKRDFLQDEVEMKVDPQKKLNQLIGLTNVKAEVHSIISFVKMQKLRRDHGLPIVPIQLHSVFTGNPGTGKTTVAKIYAELLKDCGLLKRGHLIITSRADFVAGFVGQTAIKTKRKIREALGGVLFIDEAYSLLGQTSGDFGKEVIDTLVDEMTKHNENLVIVLAGYPNEMKLLLESNPGLQSRFKKFLHFVDYSPIELLQIVESYGKQFQFQLTEEAQHYVLSRLEYKTFDGNGRFATNLMNEAIQAQSLRLMSDMSTLSILNQASIIEKADMELAFNKLETEE